MQDPMVSASGQDMLMDPSWYYITRILEGYFLFLLTTISHTEKKNVRKKKGAHTFSSYDQFQQKPYSSFHSWQAYYCTALEKEMEQQLQVVQVAEKMKVQVVVVELQALEEDEVECASACCFCSSSNSKTVAYAPIPERKKTIQQKRRIRAYGLEY